MSAVPVAEIVLFLYIIHPQPGKCGIQITVYSKERDDASLPCDNVVHKDCSTTTWIYSSTGGAVVEMVDHGKIKPYSNRGDRLKLESDCSLKISNVTSQDAGDYRCQQYLTEGGPQYGQEALVYLSVLTVSSSVPASELKVDSTVTFHCHLATYDCAQYQNQLITIGWTGHKGKTESACNISLTVTLTEEDDNRSLQCRVKWKGELKASVDYTIHLPDAAVGSYAFTEMAVRFFILFILLVVPAATVYVVYMRKRKLQRQNTCVMELEGTE